MDSGGIKTRITGNTGYTTAQKSRRLRYVFRHLVGVDRRFEDMRSEDRAKVTSSRLPVHSVLLPPIRVGYIAEEFS